MSDTIETKLVWEKVITITSIPWYRGNLEEHDAKNCDLQFHDTIKKLDILWLK